MKSHGKVVFGGDGYSAEWHRMAVEERGLKNIPTTADALPALREESIIELFRSTGVLSPVELESRFEVYSEQYILSIEVESKLVVDLATTRIYPAAMKYMSILAQTTSGMAALDIALDKTTARTVATQTNSMMAAVAELAENMAQHDFDSTEAHMKYCANGRRWGVEVEDTIPLAWLGLSGSRLDIKFRWEDSTVIDPVTGDSRVLTAVSGFRGVPDIKFRQGNEYVIDVSYRQDFEARRVAWGWRAAEQARRPVYKVNEAELYNEGILFNVFIETTRWLGVKARIEGHNLFDYFEVRDRTIYSAERGLTPVAGYTLRQRDVGRRLNLVLTGNF